MSFIDSIMVSLFCIALVFFVLVSLYALIEVFSRVLAGVKAKLAAVSVQETQMPVQTGVQTSAQPAAVPYSPEGPELSTGELKLKNVDEKTAAMIMAIVSHESSIPLSELRFKSIKEIEDK